MERSETAFISQTHAYCSWRVEIQTAIGCFLKINEIIFFSQPHNFCPACSSTANNGSWMALFLCTCPRQLDGVPSVIAYNELIFISWHIDCFVQHLRWHTNCKIIKIWNVIYKALGRFWISTLQLYWSHEVENSLLQIIFWYSKSGADRGGC